MPMQWTLDSCSPTDSKDNCQIEVDNDFNFIRFLKKCSAHQTLTDDVAGFNKLWNPQMSGENQRGPGNVQAEILDKGPTALYDLAVDGTKTFKQGITISWSWSVPDTEGDRTLGITVSGITLTTPQRNNITTFLNNRFGAGKVILA